MQNKAIIAVNNTWRAFAVGPYLADAGIALELEIIRVALDDIGAAERVPCWNCDEVVQTSFLARTSWCCLATFFFKVWVVHKRFSKQVFLNAEAARCTVV